MSPNIPAIRSADMASVGPQRTGSTPRSESPVILPRKIGEFTSSEKAVRVWSGGTTKTFARLPNFSRAANNKPLSSSQKMIARTPGRRVHSKDSFSTSEH